MAADRRVVRVGVRNRILGPDSERGVTLIMVAIQLLILTAMSTFVLDYGFMWEGRRQAQNAADAGALAGVNALAKDDKTWPALANVVVGSAKGLAEVNHVWGVAPKAVVSAECPTWMVAPNNTNCVRVDVYRDGTNGSAALPVFFGPLLGVTSQQVKATATGQVLAANTSGCMRPWFITDWYDDVNANNSFQSPPDIYTFPGYDPDLPPASGRGLGSVVAFHDNGGPSSYGQLDVGSGGADIRLAIRRCYDGPPFTVGQDVPTAPGAKVGPETQGIDDLLAWDPDSGGVHWDPITETVVGGCSANGTCACPTAAECPYGGTQSPRIVQAAICSPTEATCNGSIPGTGTVRITSILSFFITGYTKIGGKLDINAILVGSSGLQTGPAAGPGASFVTVQMLIQ